MSLIRFQPWKNLEELQKDINDIFNQGYLTEGQSGLATTKWQPTVDVQDKKDKYVITADIPGVEPKEIEVSMENGVLTIQGEKQSESKKEEEGYVRVERSSGSFYRQFSLPDTVDEANIAAKSKHGVLEITVPKTDKKVSRKIEVKG